MNMNRREFLAATAAAGAAAILQGNGRAASGNDFSGMEIKNGRMKLTLHPRTGSIARIEDTATGRSLLDGFSCGRSDGRLFRLIVPREMWWSCYADSHEQRPPEVKRNGDALTLRYANLAAHDEAEGAGITAEVTIQPSERPDEILFSLQIKNEGRREINEVRFPWLGGWTGEGQGGPWRFVHGGNGEFDPLAILRFDNRGLGGNAAGEPQRKGMLYPRHLYLPWADLSGPEGGLSYIVYMNRPINSMLSIENLARYQRGTRLAWGWAFSALMRPGETWSSPPVGLAVHRGDWHETADRFRAWYEPRIRFAAGKAAQGSMIGFQDVFFRGFDGTPIRPFKDLPRVAAIARKYGVRHLAVWDYLSMGNYSKQSPCDLLDYNEKEKELLKRVLRQAKAEGSNVSALFNFRHPCVAKVFRDPELQDRIQRRHDGTPRTENWTVSHNHAASFVPQMGPESYVYSPFSAAHRERVMRLTRDYIDLGYTSMFYDQPFEYFPDYGAFKHGGRPEETHAAAIEIIRDVRALLQARDPKALVIGEECCLFGSQWVDLWMSWSNSVASAIPSASMTHYSIPHTMLSWIVDSEPEQAAIGFALGFYLCLGVHGNEGTLEDEPALAAQVGNLAQLRKRVAERTVHARFNDTRGLQIKKSSDSMLAFSYDSPKGPAVIVAAPKTAGTIELALDRGAFAAPGDTKNGRVLCSGGKKRRRAATGRCFALRQTRSPYGSPEIQLM